MKLLHYKIIIPLAVVNLVAGLLLLKIWPSVWLWVFVTSAIINLVLVGLLFRKLKFIILPGLMPVASTAFFGLMQAGWMQIYFMIAFLVFYFFLLTAINREKDNPTNNLSGKQSFSNSFYLIAVVVFQFLFLSSVFGVVYLLQLAGVLVLPLVFAFSVAVFWAWGKIFFPYYKSVRLSLVLALGVTQIFWVVTFWPTNYLVNGLVITLLLFFLLQTTLDYVKNSFKIVTTTSRLAFILTMIILTLIFSQWETII